MTLQVARPPNPAPGVDWSTNVPGIFLYDITGITAQLATPGGPSAVAHDSSGNGLDGTYTVTTPPETFTAGLIPGDLALERQNGVLAYAAGVTFGDIGVRWGNAWTIVEWFRQPVGTGDLIIFDAVDAGLFQELRVTVAYGLVGYHVDLHDGVHAAWKTADGTVPNDGAAHMLAVTYDGTNAVCYVDGALVAWASVGAGFPVGTPLVNGSIPQGTGFGGGGPQVVADEFCTSTFQWTAGNIAGLYAARGAFAGYSAAVLALVPRAYYHLDDFVVSTGREPSLVISDGTNDVIVIPPGFPAVSTPGPFTYAWQPNLNADSQSTDGTLTTVAIPRLLVPAGYVIESRTPDIQGGDQWSNVTIWWDDSYGSLVGPVPAYDFPPGAFLQYHQIGAP